MKKFDIRNFVFILSILLILPLIGCTPKSTTPTTSPEQVAETISAMITQYVIQTQTAYVPPTDTPTPEPTLTPSQTLPVSELGTPGTPGANETPAQAGATPQVGTPGTPGAPVQPGPGQTPAAGGDVNFTDAKLYIAQLTTGYQLTVILPNEPTERKTGGFYASVAGKDFQCDDLYMMKTVNRIICVGPSLYDWRGNLVDVIVYDKDNSAPVFTGQITIPY
jgi:hypothetical protein